MHIFFTEIICTKCYAQIPTENVKQFYTYAQFYTKNMHAQILTRKHKFLLSISINF
jgi:hypothetical protein